jgi:hypothetical protein
VTVRTANANQVRDIECDPTHPWHTLPLFSSTDMPWHGCWPSPPSLLRRAHTMRCCSSVTALSRQLTAHSVSRSAPTQMSPTRCAAIRSRLKRVGRRGGIFPKAMDAQLTLQLVRAGGADDTESVLAQGVEVIHPPPPPPHTHIHVHTLLFLEDTVVKMALVGAHVCSLICLSHSLAHRQVTALRHVDANTLTLCLGFLLLMQLGPALSSSVKRKRRGSTHWGEDFLFRWNRDPDLYAQYAVVVTLKDVAKQTPRDVGYAVVRFADLPISVDDAGLRVLQGEWMFRAARDGPGRSVGACLLKRLSCPTCLQWLSSIIAHCLLTARVTRCAVPKYVHRCDTTCTFPHLWITV